MPVNARNTAETGRAGQNKLMTEGDPVGPVGSQRKRVRLALFFNFLLNPDRVA